MQLRAATYQRIQTQAQQLRLLLGLRVGVNNPNNNIYNGVKVAGVPGGHSALVDQTIAATGQLGPQRTNRGLGSSRQPRTRPLQRIRLDYRRFSRALKTVIAFDQAGAPATTNQPILPMRSMPTPTSPLTDELATSTRARPTYS